MLKKVQVVSGYFYTTLIILSMSRFLSFFWDDIYILSSIILAVIITTLFKISYSSTSESPLAFSLKFRFQ